jgi:decaprenyl-phosphate phosphoribosyltransferase
MVGAAMLIPLVKMIRPQQWVKNVFVLAPVVFAQKLLDHERVFSAIAGFACFCLLASAVYILNDLIDVEADRAHPVKKNRPIASGKVSKHTALTVMVVFAVGSLIGAWFINPWFLLTAAGYLVNNLLYCFGMKRIAYLDVLSIAAGFELRVLSGAFAADVPPSAYLLIVMFLLAMFLGLGKRMHELVQQEKSGSSSSRAVLKAYNKRLVNVLLYVTGTATLATYIVYTLDPHTHEMFGTDLLIISAVFALAGLARFLHLVRNRPDAESPTEEILTDIPFIANFILWGIAIVAIIYFD